MRTNSSLICAHNLQEELAETSRRTRFARQHSFLSGDGTC